MKRDFLSNFKLGDAALPDAVIDAILEENKRDLEAATTHPGDNGAAGGKTFTQDEVNRIVSKRLAEEKSKAEPPQEDEREKALKARESRLDCRDYLDSKKYPSGLMDVLDTTDAEAFKAAADKLLQSFPSITSNPTPPPYAGGTGSARMTGFDAAIADAFKPHTKMK